jgi:predicted ester cyclase
MSLEENKAVVQRFFTEVLNTGNVEAVGDFLTPGSFLFGFMQKFAAERLRGFPGTQFNVEESFGEGDKVAVCATMSGTNSGSMLGHPPTDKTVTVSSIWVFTLRNSKIVSLQFASDLAQQLWVAAPA